MDGSATGSNLAINSRTGRSRIVRAAGQWPAAPRPAGARCLGDDIEVPRDELDGFTIPDLDPESTLPAQEQFVLVVEVPRECPLDRRDADHSVVHDEEIDRLEGTNPPPRRGGDRDRRRAELVVAHVTLSSTRTGLADVVDGALRYQANGSPGLG